MGGNEREKLDDSQKVNLSKQWVAIKIESQTIVVTHRMKAAAAAHDTNIATSHITELATATCRSQWSLTAGWSGRARSHF